ncbi:MAG: hypothetical protein ACM3N9_01290 [Syntrophothermus sp.]
MKKLTSLVALVLVLTGTALGQCKITTALNAIKVKYDTLNYFGVDVSHVRVNDLEKVSKSASYSQVYPSAWVAFVEKEMPPYAYVKKTTRFANFNYCQKEILATSTKPNPDLVIAEDNIISPDTLKTIIKNYRLTTKSGLGLVLIPQTFSKPEEKSYTWIIFFDVRTRDILFQCMTSGGCSHMGYTAHWASGIIEGFKRFVKK